ncbi:hypothetical protein ACLX1H_006176 [Fusarium chlamydosporum]
MDSAHKTLNALLNKQPRWLHPKNEDDMARRLDELALSPTRTNSTYNSIPALDPVPNPQLVGNPTKVSLEVPPFTQYSQPQRFTPSRTTSQTREDQEEEENSHFRNFLQRPTFMTTSTNCTTGTLKSLLKGYDHPYVKTVRRLIKRYTAPLSRRGSSLSPISDEEPSTTSWLNDRDVPVYLSNEPDYLPGNFLCIDEISKNRFPCFDETEEHIKKSCFCRPIQELREPAWITAQGPSETGYRAVFLAMQDGLYEERDQFGHSVFHLMAARFMWDKLLEAIRSGQGTGILNEQNTAGQTLLHVLHPCWFQKEPLLRDLLDALARNGFDFSARDHYGRSFSHILLLKDASADLRNHLLRLSGPTDYQKRDAFNITPIDTVLSRPTVGINRAYTQAMDLDPQVPISGQNSADPYHTIEIQQEIQLINCIESANHDPLLQDQEGRNGLHCLAAATLSSISVTQKYDLDKNGMPTSQRSKRDKAAKCSDSSTDRLQFRRNLLETLLAAGVDPNHYDIHGNTPLMAFAAQLPEDDDYTTGPEIIEDLIAAGARVNARNRAGETALHVAVRCGHKLAVKQLVNSGANVHARDAAGRSVLEVADVKMRSLSGQDEAG